MENLGLIVTIAAAAIGATWALRTKLGDIEVAMAKHVEEDTQIHKSHEARVIKLEQRRRR